MGGGSATASDTVASSAGKSLATPAREDQREQSTATQGASANESLMPTNTKLQRWVGIWYNPESQPQKLQGNDKTTLSSQKRCWSCHGLGHRDNDACCFSCTKRINVARVTEVESNSENV